jgi:hypothetical protein
VGGFGLYLFWRIYGIGIPNQSVLALLAYWFVLMIGSMFFGIGVFLLLPREVITTYMSAELSSAPPSGPYSFVRPDEEAERSLPILQGRRQHDRINASPPRRRRSVSVSRSKPLRLLRERRHRSGKCPPDVMM